MPFTVLPSLSHVTIAAWVEMGNARAAASAGSVTNGLMRVEIEPLRTEEKR